MRTNFRQPIFGEMEFRSGTFDGRPISDFRDFTPPAPAPRGWSAVTGRAGQGRIVPPAFVFEPSAADARLPERARLKVARLRNQASDAFAVLRSVSDERAAAMQERTRCDQRLADLRRQGCRDDHPSVAEAQARREALAAQVAALDARSAEIGPPGILRAIDEWLRRLPQGIAITEHPPVAPKLAKGEVPLAAVERIRHEIAELAADLHAVRSAPVPSAVVKARIAEQVAAIAARGRPDVLRSLELGTPLPWPTENVMATVQGHVVMAEAPHIVGFATHSAADAMGLFAWLFQDELTARLVAEVDELSDDAAALTDEERSDRQRAILDEVLELGREEEAAVELAEAQGMVIARRRDSDPRAVLGLSSDLPAPRD